MSHLIRGVRAVGVPRPTVGQLPPWHEPTVPHPSSSGTLAGGKQRDSDQEDLKPWASMVPHSKETASFPRTIAGGSEAIRWSGTPLNPRKPGSHWAGHRRPDMTLHSVRSPCKKHRRRGTQHGKAKNINLTVDRMRPRSERLTGARHTAGTLAVLSCHCKGLS